MLAGARRGSTAAGGEARDRPAEGAARPVNREPQLLLRTGVVAGIPRLRAGEVSNEEVASNP